MLQRLIVLTPLLSTAACGANRSAPAPESTNPADRAEERPVEMSDEMSELIRKARRTTLTVKNEIWGPVSIQVMREGSSDPARLGTARNGASSTFVIPPSIVPGEGVRLHFIAHPIGDARTLVTEPLTIDRSDRITWRVKEPLQISNATFFVEPGPEITVHE